MLCSTETTRGELAEWLMAPVLKTGIPGRVSGVRIPHSPPVPPQLVDHIQSAVRKLSALEIDSKYGACWHTAAITAALISTVAHLGHSQWVLVTLT